MKPSSKLTLDQIPFEQRNALEICDLIMRFVALSDMYPPKALEIAAEYLEHHLSRDDEVTIREFAPQIAKFLRNQMDMTMTLKEGRPMTEHEALQIVLDIARAHIGVPGYVCDPEDEQAIDMVEAMIANLAMEEPE